MIVRVIDNLLNKSEQADIYSYCRKKEYYRGERDDLHLPATGLTTEITNNNIIKILLEKTNNNKVQLIRSYINLFIPGEKPYYHQDHTDINNQTLLYYANTENIDLNEGGETFFVIENHRKAIPFVPGRVIIFDANLWHKASSFRNLDRYTIALKWRSVI